MVEAAKQLAEVIKIAGYQHRRVLSGGFVHLGREFFQFFE